MYIVMRERKPSVADNKGNFWETDIMLTRVGAFFLLLLARKDGLQCKIGRCR